MVRHWSLTLFFVVAELWGDVVLSLLFWALANETTPIAMAPVLYPLFGLGANLSQALAGFVTRTVAMSAASHAAADPWGEQLQLLLSLVGLFGVVIMVMHQVSRLLLLFLRVCRTTKS